MDSRSAFATQDRFGDIEIAREWPDEALPKIGVDGRTALIALTHAAKIDDPALIYALTSDAFYVGALESKKTHGKAPPRLRCHPTASLPMSMRRKTSASK